MDNIVVGLTWKTYPDTYQLICPQKSLNFKTNKTNVKWPKTKVSYETIMNDNQGRPEGLAVGGGASQKFTVRENFTTLAIRRVTLLPPPSSVSWYYHTPPPPLPCGY